MGPLLTLFFTFYISRCQFLYVSKGVNYWVLSRKEVFIFFIIKLHRNFREKKSEQYITKILACSDNIYDNTKGLSIRSVRNRDFVAEYKQSVFWHISLRLNRRTHMSSEIVLRCLEPASTQTSYPNTF